MAKEHTTVFRKDKIVRQAKKEFFEMYMGLNRKELLDGGTLNKLRPKPCTVVLKHDNESKHGGRQKQRRKTGQLEFVDFECKVRG